MRSWLQSDSSCFGLYTDLQSVHNTHTCAKVWIAALNSVFAGCCHWNATLAKWIQNGSYSLCEEKWVWKLWGQWTSRRLQLFTWTSFGDVTVTVQTFIVSIIRENRMCIHIQLTQNIVLFQNIPTQSHNCNWRKTEYLNEWSLCCSLMVLKIGGHDLSVYL